MIKIEMQNVCLGYSRKELLRDVTFHVLPGEMVGLIGPNGCGKSTSVSPLGEPLVYNERRSRIKIRAFFGSGECFRGTSQENKKRG